MKQETKLIYPLNVQNYFVFNSSPRDFSVEEIPLYAFSGEGEHLVLFVRKKELTTWEMLNIFSSHLGINKREIGYAGLKDKHAMTMQYISLPAKHEEKLASFTHEKIKILTKTRHNNKIRVGHLKGNHFKMRLKKVLGVEKSKLDSSLKWIESHGLPNYFGSQRFGIDGTNWQEGKRILDGELKMRDRKTREFLISAYQSYLFNAWLSKRMELNLLLQKFTEEECEGILGLQQGSLKGVKTQEHFFKLLKGELMMHYPYGKLFEADDLSEESKRFSAKDIAPTGLISGKKVTVATSSAGEIEKTFDASLTQAGARRYAWVQVENVSHSYVEEKAQYELSFSLPKGCYATNVLDVLRGKKE